MSDNIYGVLISSNELRHFGVKGMRWGVRKSRKGGGRSSGSGRKKTMGLLERVGKASVLAIKQTSVFAGKAFVGAAIGYGTASAAQMLVSQLGHSQIGQKR